MFVILLSLNKQANSFLVSILSYSVKQMFPKQLCCRGSHGFAT